MRFSLFTLTALTVGLLASFSNARSDNELEARDIEYFLEQREMLDALSTRELIEELSVRLDRRYSHTCGKCGKYFKSSAMYDNHVCKP
ncbi:hypothetical protein DFP72DRAFT_85772 [Ephemerocybe angulata]|uniref:C2H2-type domain-containing protein n=1 Tax=Ephemerocybe angulata TaxID=980116 RepID=A0A8H6HDC7_9AGAR|nr:hypothetical protein DFP72DRAFT_85772 [Tulosesus angulatus]